MTGWTDGRKRAARKATSSPKPARKEEAGPAGAGLSLLPGPGQIFATSTRTPGPIVEESVTDCT